MNSMSLFLHKAETSEISDLAGLVDRGDLQLMMADTIAIKR